MKSLNLRQWNMHDCEPGGRLLPEGRHITIWKFKVEIKGYFDTLSMLCGITVTFLSLQISLKFIWQISDTMAWQKLFSAMTPRDHWTFRPLLIPLAIVPFFFFFCCWTCAKIHLLGISEVEWIDWKIPPSAHSPKISQDDNSHHEWSERDGVPDCVDEIQAVKDFLLDIDNMLECQQQIFFYAFERFSAYLFFTLQNTVLFYALYKLYSLKKKRKAMMK